VYKILYNVAAGNIILVCAGSIPGYWTTVALVDTVGRKPIQMLGFVALTILFLVWGFDYNNIAAGPMLGIYVLAQFFFNFGMLSFPFPPTPFLVSSVSPSLPFPSPLSLSLSLSLSFSFSFPFPSLTTSASPFHLPRLILPQDQTQQPSSSPANVSPPATAPPPTASPPPPAKSAPSSPKPPSRLSASTAPSPVQQGVTPAPGKTTS
jgi:hypothetical protein